MRNPESISSMLIVVLLECLVVMRPSIVQWKRGHSLVFCHAIEVARPQPNEPSIKFY